MAEQNLNRGIELHSKAQALSVAFPLGGRGAATAFPPPSVPSVFTNSPCYPTILVFSCSPSYARSANNETTPERGTAAWRAFRPFLSSSFSLSLSLLFLFLSYYFVPCNPFPGSTSSSAVRGRSCRFLKCKYPSRNKRQRLAVQDESIVSA